MSYKPQNQGAAKVGSILEVELDGGDTNQIVVSQVSTTEFQATYPNIPSVCIYSIRVFSGTTPQYPEKTTQLALVLLHALNIQGTTSHRSLFLHIAGARGQQGKSGAIMKGKSKMHANYNHYMLMLLPCANLN